MKPVALGGAKGFSNFASVDAVGRAPAAACGDHAWRAESTGAAPLPGPRGTRDLVRFRYAGSDAAAEGLCLTAGRPKAAQLDPWCATNNNMCNKLNFT